MGSNVTAAVGGANSESVVQPRTKGQYRRAKRLFPSLNTLASVRADRVKPLFPRKARQ